MSRNATPQTEKSLWGDICQKTAAKRRLEISGQCNRRTFGVESVRSVAEIIVLYSASISQLVTRQVSPVAFEMFAQGFLTLLCKFEGLLLLQRKLLKWLKSQRYKTERIQVNLFQLRKL